MQQVEIQAKNTDQEKISEFEEWVHQWGNSISEAVLDLSCKYFQTPDIEGFIGYRISKNCAVVLGDPICPPEKKPDLALAFQKYCNENNLSCIYFIVSQEFARWAIDHVSKIMIEVGEEIIFDPFLDPTVGHKGYKLRNRIHHAQHLGLTVKEYIPFNQKIESDILNVGNTWVQARTGPQIHLGNLNFFENRSDKRWFYLQDENKTIIGMALLSKLNLHDGWLLKFLITVPDVPRGSSELLMLTILETLRNENCRYITYGMVPADQLGEIKGMGKITAWMAKNAFNMAKWTFNLDQRKVYWHKFLPHTESTYLLFSNPYIGINELKALANTLKTEF